MGWRDKGVMHRGNAEMEYNELWVFLIDVIWQENELGCCLSGVQIILPITEFQSLDNMLSQSLLWGRGEDSLYNVNVMFSK